MQDLWIVFAAVAAASLAGFFLVNEIFRVGAIHLAWWMRGIVFAFCLPFLSVFAWPDDPVFYLLMFCSAAIFSTSDIAALGMSGKNGAGSVSRIEPLTVGSTFVLWCALTPQMVFQYLNEPLRALGIIATLLGCLYFALRLRRCEINRETLRVLSPFILSGAVGIVLGKMAMDRVPPPEGAYFYALLQCGLAFFFYSAAMRISAVSSRIPAFGSSSGLFDRRVMLAGFCGAMVWLIHAPSKYTAISMVENPAYVTVIGLTGPLWVLLAHKIMGTKERGDVVSGLGIVLCAALLVIFSRF